MKFISLLFFSLVCAIEANDTAIYLPLTYNVQFSSNGTTLEPHNTTSQETTFLTTSEVPRTTRILPVEDDEGHGNSLVFDLFFYTFFGIVMIAMGTSVDLHILRERFQDPKGILIAWIHQFCLLPFVAYCTTQWFGTPSVYAVALKIQSMCPGGANSNMLCFIGMTDVAMSIACTTLSTFSALFMMPFWMTIYLPDEESIDFVIAMENILISLTGVLAGTGFGIWIDSRYPFIGGLFQKTAGPAMFAILGMVIWSFIDGDINPFEPDEPASVFPATCLVPIFGAFSALLISSILDLPKPQRIAVAIETSCQNNPLALAIIYSIYTGDDEKKAASVPFLYSLFSLSTNVTILIFSFFNRWTYADPEKSWLENWIHVANSLKKKEGKGGINRDPNVSYDSFQEESDLNEDVIIAVHKL